MQSQWIPKTNKKYRMFQNITRLKSFFLNKTTNLATFILCDYVKRIGVKRFVTRV